MHVLYCIYFTAPILVVGKELSVCFGARDTTIDNGVDQPRASLPCTSIAGYVLPVRLGTVALAGCSLMIMVLAKRGVTAYRNA